MINFSYYKMKLLTCHFVQGTAFPLNMFYHPCSENAEHLKKKKTSSETVSGVQSNLVNTDAKETEPKSVSQRCPYYNGTSCMKLGISETATVVQNREVPL